MNVTIIGCGNGAFAAAADLTIKGHNVTLYVDRTHGHNFSAIENTKVINCIIDEIMQPIEIDDVTTDIKQALSRADVIIPIVPSFAHYDIAKSLAPYISDKQHILLAPGSTGGALVFAKVFSDFGMNRNITISEVHTLPYVARKINANTVKISLFVKKLYFSTFPAKRCKELFGIMCNLFNNMTLVTDVIETGLNNGNLVIHPAPVIFNVGKIEYYNKHYHYKEGITPSVGKVIQKIDDERKQICKAFGYKEIDMKQRLYDQGDCELKDNVYDTVQSSKNILIPLEGPNDLNSRYLVEDTKYTLVAAIAYAEIAGVSVPLMRSILYLANALKDEDYMRSGRNALALGIDGLSVKEVKEYLYYGIKEEL